MGVVRIAGEVRIEIWITFPKRILVAIRDSGVTIIVRLIDRISATWQAIAVGKVNRFGN
jgi:hypothetical protein